MKEISIGSSVLSGPHLCSPPLVVLPHPLFVLSWPSLMFPAPCYAPPSIVCSLPTLPTHCCALLSVVCALSALTCDPQPSLVLPTPCHAPLSIIHTLLALTNAPPPLVVCFPSIVHAPTICCSFNPIHSWFVLIHTCSTLCALSLCLLLLFLLWLMLYIWVPLGCLCLFTLIWSCVPLVYAHSPLFALPDAIPAVVATAHTHALTLALGSCVPTLHVSLLFVVPYL